jgi:Restriction endonuclease BamHI
MKIETENFLIKNGPFSDSIEFGTIMKEINAAIQCVTWHSPTKFIVNPVKRGNGVFPIKDNFIKYLKDLTWLPENKMTLAIGMNPGAIDAVKPTKFGLFAVEWETGNISSSHRALNKIAVGILQRQIIGGVLILPTKAFSRYLTDRVGNYEELAPYFPMYQNLHIVEGVICVISIEHDDIDLTAPLIRKGKDGNAKKKEF